MHLTRLQYVYGFEDVPDLTPDTRLGNDLYGEILPLVMGTGMGSLTARAVGTVTSLGVDDGVAARLWMVGQLKVHDQYRAHVARLVAQGAVDATALVMPHHIQRDGRGRVSELPVAAVALTPVAA